jgi:hypothetical protein
MEFSREIYPLGQGGFNIYNGEEVSLDILG